MLDIRELTTDRDLAEAFPLMQQLRPHLRAEEFPAAVRRQQAEGYRLIGGFDGSELVVLAGVRDALTLMRGPHLFVDNLVTRQAQQRSGHGKAMLQWLAGHARGRRLERIYLDSRDTALGFYRGQGFKSLTSVTCWVSVGLEPA